MILWKLDCRSGKQKRKNQPITRPGIEHCDWFIHPPLFATMQFSLDRKRRSHKRNRCSALRRFDFHWIVSLYASDYDSDYDSVVKVCRQFNASSGIPRKQRDGVATSWQQVFVYSARKEHKSTLGRLLYIIRLFPHLQSNQVKRAPQDYSNELIIWILNPPVVSRMQ